MKDQNNGMANQQQTNAGLRELALFAGAGGGILGGKLLGWRTVCAVEWDAYAASVLVSRQNDGCLEAFPVWDDVQTFDGRPWKGLVDVVSGGFPCQDISAAGKGAGIDGERSGLWKEMARIIGEVRPRFVFVENSPMLTLRGLDRVLGDLSTLGYDARWGVVGAIDTGAPHRRDRIWIVADATRARTRKNDRRIWPGACGTNRGQGAEAKDVADAAKLHSDGCDNYAGECVGGKSLSELGDNGWENDVAYAAGERGQLSAQREFTAVKLSGSHSEKRSDCGVSSKWWATEPELGRVAHGVAARVDRLRCLGNGQVPAVAATAWRILGGE